MALTFLGEPQEAIEASAACLKAAGSRLAGWAAAWSRGSAWTTPAPGRQRAHHTPPAQPTSADALPPRERQVAQLVAEELSKCDIAARPAADSHVNHILTKIGFANRGQIAASVAEHTQDPPEAPPRRYAHGRNSTMTYPWPSR
jgi:DNA-binding NarL/FixJ family response regulator